MILNEQEGVGPLETENKLSKIYNMVFFIKSVSIFETWWPGGGGVATAGILETMHTSFLSEPGGSIYLEN